MRPNFTGPWKLIGGRWMRPYRDETGLPSVLFGPTPDYSLDIEESEKELVGA